MLYQSTRGSGKRLTAAEAITQGLAEDGGLFVPESIPKVTEKTINDLCAMPYSGRAAHIMGPFLDDFSSEELSRCTFDAYSDENFDHPAIAPLHKLENNTYFLELWHGPTCAFKDMALQVMPRLLTASLLKTGDRRRVCVLVATSGDTGKAALEGFRDVPGTSIMVFYPRDGVSEVQKLQMTSQSGENVNVVAVEGNFDDAQTGVKAIFTNESLRRELNELGYFLSSANSINWGRLAPQIAYYFSAYCDLLGAGEIQPGEKINFCVPTGNFGNILAAYYAAEMGLPVKKLICASNSNDVLTQFMNTGVYDRNRPFYTTSSPSMDILISSNLERLLFNLAGKDGDTVKELMTALSSEGRYEIPDKARIEAIRVFTGGRCSEESTMNTIADVFSRYDYLIDTHTAVAYRVLSDYRDFTGDNAPSVVVSTASPFKFSESVLSALEGMGAVSGAGPAVTQTDTSGLGLTGTQTDTSGAGPAGMQTDTSGHGLTDTLSEVTGIAIPGPILALKGKKPRFTDEVAPAGMKDAVLGFLK